MHIELNCSGLFTEPATAACHLCVITRGVRLETCVLIASKASSLVVAHFNGRGGDFCRFGVFHLLLPPMPLKTPARCFALFKRPVAATFRVVELRARTRFDPRALLNWIRAIRPFAFRTRASATFFSRHPEVTIADDCFSIIERAHFMKPKEIFCGQRPDQAGEVVSSDRLTGLRQFFQR